MVKEWTGYKIPDFFPSKSAMVEPTCEKLNIMRQLNKLPKYLRMDNGGENVKLEKRLQSKDWKIPITIEYTARDTPQCNSLVEVGFATLGSQARAMMLNANVPKNKRMKLMPKAIEAATFLDGFVPIRRGCVW